MTDVLLTEITYFGHSLLSTCDLRCDKAWGMNGRRAEEGTMIEFDENDPDDMAYLPDQEVGEAPRDPGTYEGGEGKPMYPRKHNKWCVRECERQELIDPGKEIVIRDFSKPRYNISSRHPEADDTEISLGRVFTPSEPFVSGKATKETI